jgi:DNA-directed RNA polymerase beta subunit
VDTWNQEDILIHIEFVQVFPKTIGDKFVSDHAQKGICDQQWPWYFLPVTEESSGDDDDQEGGGGVYNGIVPHIIINPHAFPGRMTVGQLIAAFRGMGLIHSPLSKEDEEVENFSLQDIEDTSAILRRAGLHDRGRVPMRHPITGDPFQCQLFMGITRYHSLPHLVEAKEHARSKGGGRRQFGSLQIVKGRKQNGGVRLGEMELALLVAQGATYQMMCWLSHHAGQFFLDICNECGLMAPSNEEGVVFCQPCQSSKATCRVKTTGAFKSTLQLMMGSGIFPRVFAGTSDEEDLDAEAYTEQLEHTLGGRI